MKKFTLLFSVLLIVLFCACSGSENYRGNWKALDANGNKFDITFDAKSFVVKDASNKKTKFDYTQNSVSIENSVSTYGIKLDDGRGYKITFPKSDDESVGLIQDENGVPLYTIGRSDFVKYQDIYSLQ